MLIKWITCEVVDRIAFARGQQAWRALREVPGFLGQCGGWGRGAAHIFGFWQDRGSHELFRTTTHDRIAAAQAGTHRGLGVRLLDRRLDIGAGFPAGLGGAGVLRLAHCHIRPGRSASFTRVQEKVWIPGMAAAPGMLGGVVGRAGAAELAVLTAWRTAADHRSYQDEIFPGLFAAATPAHDTDTVTGDVITLDPAWTVHA